MFRHLNGLHELVLEVGFLVQVDQMHLFLDPGVLQQGVGVRSSPNVLLQTHMDNVSQVRGVDFGDRLVDAGLDLDVQEFQVPGLEGGPQAGQFVHDAAQRPDVAFGPVGLV